MRTKEEEEAEQKKEGRFLLGARQEEWVEKEKEGAVKRRICFICWGCMLTPNSPPPTWTSSLLFFVPASGPTRAKNAR